MKIFLNDAGNGDCIVLQAKDTSIMIDGGTAASYNIWKENLANISKINALFVTHIDNDHVNGLIRMFEAASHPDIYEVFYNGIEQLTHLKLNDDSLNNTESSVLDSLISNFSEAIQGECDIGFAEGTSLSYLLKSLNYNVNKRFDNCAITNESPHGVFEVGDVSIELIGPSQDNLISLKNIWLELLSEYDITMRVLHKKHSIAFERYISSLNESDDIQDISETNDTTIEYLSNLPFLDDSSLNNKSSISFLAECDKKKILFLADSDVNTIIKWMDGAGYETIEVDAVKLPHHGSKHNYNKALLERIYCSNYLISTNGNKHGHPDLETLARIVKYSKKQPVNIYINHDVPHIDNSFKEKFAQYSMGSNIFTNVKEFVL